MCSFNSLVQNLGKRQSVWWVQQVLQTKQNVINDIQFQSFRQHLDDTQFTSSTHNKLKNCPRSTLSAWLTVLTLTMIHDPDLQPPVSYGHDLLACKHSISTVSQYRIRVETNWQTERRTDGGNCITCRINEAHNKTSHDGINSQINFSCWRNSLLTYLLILINNSGKMTSTDCNDDVVATKVAGVNAPLEMNVTAPLVFTVTVVNMSRKLVFQARWLTGLCLVVLWCPCDWPGFSVYKPVVIRPSRVHLSSELRLRWVVPTRVIVDDFVVVVVMKYSHRTI